MTSQRWLTLAAILVAALALLIAVAAWRSRPGHPLSANEIRDRTAAEMNRIESRAAEFERNAAQ